jgi:predicted transcriptional regulator
LTVALAATRNDTDRVISPAQVRAARALLQMKQVDLAAASGVSLQAIKNFERGTTDARGTTFQRIERALREAGVIFVDDGEVSASGGPGVRLAR